MMCEERKHTDCTTEANSLCVTGGSNVVQCAEKVEQDLRSEEKLT